MLNLIQLEPFQPARGITNGHTQTVVGRLARRQNGLIFHRWRIDTPDGDFLDLDFPEVPGFPLDESVPLVLLLHGLEGNARKGYACETYRQLAQHGIRSVGINYRSCSGVINRRAKSYHAGMTDDVSFVIQQLREWYPYVPLAAVGFSLGGNILLKYLGEQGQNTPLVTAVAISPPFNLEQSTLAVQTGFSQMYQRMFLSSIREKAQARAHLISDKVDMEQVLAAQTFREIDEALVVPLYGFGSVQEYYVENSCGKYLPHLAIPTLILRAMDDPVFDPQDVPRQILFDNHYIQAGLTEIGGHVGFVEGRPGHFRCWSERQAARFLAAQLRPVFSKQCSVISKPNTEH
ncbi:MAG: alpha/beta fold hydrolase [Chloroflexi bacterium]|nr:alpha/beta fold hydrolase [Chloroflexota bacterium]